MANDDHGSTVDRLTPQRFQQKWRGVALTERAAAHSHFLDLCEALGVPKPTDLDPHGTFYAFEKGAEKLGGGKGFADVWHRGHFAWEYKGRHKDLEAAYRQLVGYKDDLENPPLLIACDLDRIEVRTNFTGARPNRVLDRIKRSGDIFFAWDDEPWIIEGAAVRISIVGFDDGSESDRMLDGVAVAAINADLTSQSDLSVAKRLPQNAGVGFVGDVKAGKFDVPGDVARRWRAMPANANGRPNSDVVRPWVNSLDILRRSRDMWIVDFGIDMPETEAAHYEAPFAHVERLVKPERAKVKRAKYRDYWWLHAEPVTGMRRATESLARFIVTPTVAKHRIFAWLSGTVLADHQLIVFARDDDDFFGVLHSRAHEVWSLRMGTSLEDRPRYTPTTCFETSPLPWPPGHEPADDPRLDAVAAAARAMDDHRRTWLNPEDASEADLKKRTLTNLYNARPTWLAHLHAALDRAVWAAYGWDNDPATTTDEEILGRLLALNLERATAEA